VDLEGTHVKRLAVFEGELRHRFSAGVGAVAAPQIGEEILRSDAEDAGVEP
jgi:hypothetical protein